MPIIIQNPALLAAFLVVTVAWILVVARAAYRRGFDRAFMDRARKEEQRAMAARRANDLAQELVETKQRLENCIQRRENLEASKRLHTGQLQEAHATIKQASANLAAARIDRKNLHAFCFSLAKLAMSRASADERRVLRALNVEVPGGRSEAWARMAQHLGVELAANGSPKSFTAQDAPPCLRSRTIFQEGEDARPTTHEPKDPS